MNQIIKIKGIVEIVVRDRDGNLKKRVTNHNLITSVGKAGIAGLVSNLGSVTVPTYLAVGSSTTSPAVGQTALGSEITTNGLARAVATVTRQTTTVTNDTVQYVYTWSVSGSQDVQEVGVFNASSSGIMFGRALLAVTGLVNGDQLTATYKIIFS